MRTGPCVAAVCVAALAATAAVSGGGRGGRSSAAAGPTTEAGARAAMEAVRPLHVPLGPPAPDEWRASFPEPGQTFDEYLRGDPVTARGERRVLYVQPLGEFSPAQRRVVDLTAEF